MESVKELLQNNLVSLISVSMVMFFILVGFYRRTKKTDILENLDKTLSRLSLFSIISYAITDNIYILYMYIFVQMCIVVINFFMEKKESIKIATISMLYKICIVGAFILVLFVDNIFLEISFLVLLIIAYIILYFIKKKIKTTESVEQ